MCDGYTSASIFINFMDCVYPEWAPEHLSWIHHFGKTHGLSDVIDDILQSSKDYKLVVVPDGGSGDIEQHKLLAQKGIDCVIVDHHDYKTEEESPAVIVNIQSTPYPDKYLTGAGVVQRFIECYNELYLDGKVDTDRWMDICALGNAADQALYLEPEIRAIINIGYQTLENPFIKGLAEKNAFIIEKRNGLNYLSGAYGLSPFINALTRSGEMGEKEIVFDAMLDRNTNKIVASTKRGHVGQEVSFWEEAVLIADRVKRRQTELQKQAMELVEQRIDEENLNDNAAILCLCEPGEIASGIVGLGCNLIQSKYQKPAMILTYHEDEDAYIGSMRNYSLSPLDNFKKVLEETGEIEWCAGHANSAGVCVKKDKIDSLIKALNKRYAGIDQTPVYWVDYIWDKNTIDAKTVMELGKLDIFGQGIPESKVAVEQISLSESNVILMSKDKNPTLKIKCGDVDLIKFHSSEQEFKDFTSGNKTLTIVGKPSINNWQGNVSAQILIDDFILEEQEEHELSWEDF